MRAMKHQVVLLPAVVAPLALPAIAEAAGTFRA